MSICPCGYWWADLDEDGTPISLEYCHYEGPAEWAPCEQDDDEYANEACFEEEEEEEAREEAEFDAWLESIEELHMMQSARNCPHCPKWFWCSMLPDECEMEPITEEELKGVETNGTYSESLDW